MVDKGKDCQEADRKRVHDSQEPSEPAENGLAPEPGPERKDSRAPSRASASLVGRTIAALLEQPVEETGQLELGKAFDQALHSGALDRSTLAQILKNVEPFRLEGYAKLDNATVKKMLAIESPEARQNLESLLRHKGIEQSLINKIIDGNGASAISAEVTNNYVRSIASGSLSPKLLKRIEELAPEHRSAYHSLLKTQEALRGSDRLTSPTVETLMIRDTAPPTLDIYGTAMVSKDGNQSVLTDRSLQLILQRSTDDRVIFQDLLKGGQLDRNQLQNLLDRKHDTESLVAYRELLSRKVIDVDSLSKVTGVDSVVLRRMIAPNTGSDQCK